jgi:hypothetical protein
VDKFYNPALFHGLALAVQELDSLGVQRAQAAARLYQSFQCAPGRRSRVSNPRGYCAVEREGSRGGVSEIASELAPWAPSDQRSCVHMRCVCVFVRAYAAAVSGDSPNCKILQHTAHRVDTPIIEILKIFTRLQK